MAPKRKASGTGATSSTSSKSTSNKANGKSTSEPASKKARSSTKKEVVVVSDDEEPVASSSKAASKSPPKKKAATRKKKAASAKAKKNRKNMPFDQAFDEWFSEYADSDDPDKMDGEGIERLFQDMNLTMEGVAPFVLAWKTEAPPSSMGSFQKSNMRINLRPHDIKDVDDLKKLIDKTEQEVYNDRTSTPFLEIEFDKFYKFIFGFVKPEGQRSLDGEVAWTLWSMVLSPHNKLADEFVKYAQELGPQQFRGVSKDVWDQLPKFVSTVGNDLAGYSEDDSWPTVFDAFVEWKKAKGEQ